MAQDSPNKSTPAADLPDARQLERITDFFHEAGHLRHTPRSGYAFLGSGSENVAEHSYRTSVIGQAGGSRRRPRDLPLPFP